MKTTLRLSPVHSLLQQLQGSWREINGMPVLATVNHSPTSEKLSIVDLSCLRRCGFKGENSQQWLGDRGIICDRPNTWTALPEQGIVARLGLNEFLIEDSLNSQVVSELAACSDFPPKVYPVLRQDLAIGLWGEQVNELLLQTCGVNFRSLSLVDRPVVLTSMIGVAVIVIPGEHQGLPFYRIWCDGTFGVYFWKTIAGIAQELGGGAIGLDDLGQFDPELK